MNGVPWAVKRYRTKGKQLTTTGEERWAERLVAAGCNEIYSSSARSPPAAPPEAPSRSSSVEAESSEPSRSELAFWFLRGTRDVYFYLMPASKERVPVVIVEYDEIAT